MSVGLGVVGCVTQENLGVRYGTDHDEMMLAGYEESFRREFGYFPGRFTLAQWRSGEARAAALKRGGDHEGLRGR